MTSVLAVIQRVCPKIGLQIPSAVFGSTEREHIELAELANDVAERLTEAFDWQALTAEHTFTGDGTTEAFDYPDDFNRLILDGDLWSSRYNGRLIPLDANTYLGREVRGFDAVSNYTIISSQFRIKPIMDAGETVRFFYIKDCPIFTEDEDTFLLNERLLRLGMIWQWREQKGLPYAEDMENYEIALSKATLKDSGSKAIQIGGGRLTGYKIAYPTTISTG